MSEDFDNAFDEIANAKVVIEYFRIIGQLYLFKYSKVLRLPK